MRRKVISHIKWTLWGIADIVYDLSVCAANCLKFFLMGVVGIAILIIYALWLIAFFLTPFALLWFLLS